MWRNDRLTDLGSHGVHERRRERGGGREAQGVAVRAQPRDESAESRHGDVREDVRRAAPPAAASAFPIASFRALRNRVARVPPRKKAHRRA